MFTKAYWKKLIEDVVSAASAAALSILGLDAVNALSVEWVTVGAVALGAAVVTVLKGLAAKNFSDPQSPRVTE